MTQKTLYLVVNCCMEESRYGIMQQVIQSLKSEQAKKGLNVEKDMIAFDNGSTYPGGVDLLRQLNCPTFSATENMGYWSAVKWVLDSLPCIMPDHEKYEYVYIIESDHFHFALEKIENCEQALEKYPHLGSVRAQEYSVAESHLYNKTLRHPQGRPYAWVSHVNAATGAPVKLNVLDPKLQVYESNFLTCLHSVNRIAPLKAVFDELSRLDKFSEHDFQRMYMERYPVIGQLDGGVFHARLGFTPENPRSLSGSWSHDVSQYGYKETRRDRILEYAEGSVLRLS